MDIFNNFQLEKDAERGAELVLRNPRTGKELVDETTNEKLIIKILGTDSRQHAELEREEEKRLLIDGDDYDSKAGLIRIASGLIVSWSNIHIGDELLEFSRENAIKLLEIKWVLDQVKLFAETRTNFFLNSSEQSE